MNARKIAIVGIETALELVKTASTKEEAIQILEVFLAEQKDKL